ncbi:MAG: DUF3298 domain-containing protein [Neisseriaceae bacterium]|nr:DUF3298 domain-containing protein [Neisseriaceae bacterium]
MTPKHRLLLATFTCASLLLAPVGAKTLPHTVDNARQQTAFPAVTMKKALTVTVKNEQGRWVKTPVAELSYPKFQARWLNQLVEKPALAWFKQDAQEMHESFVDFQKDEPNAFAWSANQHVYVSAQGPRLLVVTREYDTYSGGAHGSAWVHFDNIDVKNQRVVTLPDLFSAAELKALTRIAEPFFRLDNDVKATETLTQAGYWFEKDQFKLPEQFALTEDGLLFVYGQYEVAPYSMGMPDFVLPYRAIAKAQDGKSLLSQLVAHLKNKS